jgi:hypothetical protein
MNAEKIHRAIAKLIEQDGDHCSICRAPLRHGGPTFGGLRADGTVADVGECCMTKLTQVLTAGLYFSKERDQAWR